MRNYLLLATASLLAACGGAGAESVGSAGSVAAPSTSPTPTPTASFVNPTEAKTYQALGGVQHYQYYTNSNTSGQGGQLYAGDANTARDSGITITYDPRDAIFDITINRPKSTIAISDQRFQDPAHRTAFGGLAEPQASVPNLTSSGVQYLQSGSSSGSLDPNAAINPGTAQSDYPVGAKDYSSTTQTFFYQKPGTTTRYVTYAGYVRNTLSVAQLTDASNQPFLRYNYGMDRAAFVYGERTDNAAVPKSGTGTFTGDMIATLVFNPRIDTDPNEATYFQWLNGTQTTTVDFGSLAVKTTMSGTVSAPALDAYTNGAFDLPTGSTFSASAHATIDLVGKGGFTGSFDSAKFVRPGASDFALNIAGSSIDGAFFGPNAEEVGGGFRIVGGTPDQRIDILGAFTGKK